MIRSGCFLISILWLCAPSFGQNAKFKKYLNQDEYARGTVVLTDGNVTHGLIRKRSEIQMHSKVQFVDSLGQKQTFKPDQLDFYTFEGKRFKADAQSGYFYQLVEKGLRVSLYKRKFKPSNTQTYDVQPNSTRERYELTEGMAYEDLGTFRFLYKESSGTFLKIPQEGGFHEALSKFLADCSVLAQRIRDKEFNEPDLQDIMNVYNFSCESK